MISFPIYNVLYWFGMSWVFVQIVDKHITYILRLLEWSVCVCRLFVIDFQSILSFGFLIESARCAIGQKCAWMAVSAHSGQRPFVMSIVLQKSFTNNLILEYTYFKHVYTSATTTSRYEWSVEFGAISIARALIPLKTQTKATERRANTTPQRKWRMPPNRLVNLLFVF